MAVFLTVYLFRYMLVFLLFGSGRHGAIPLADDLSNQIQQIVEFVKQLVQMQRESREIVTRIQGESV